jgi:hypothetical protein
MGHLEVRLHTMQETTTEAVCCPADYISSSFSGQGLVPDAGPASSSASQLTGE